MYFKNPSLAGKRSQKVQARNRLASPAPDYRPILDPSKLFKRITIESVWLNDSSTNMIIDLYPCRHGRRDQYRAMIDGNLLSDKISLTTLLIKLRKMI